MKPQLPLAYSEWRGALEAGGRRTISKSWQTRGSNPQDAPGRKRGKLWDNDSTSWPASRLIGVHRLGCHEGGNHFCDFPECTLKNSSYVKTPRPTAGRGSRGGTNHHLWDCRPSAAATAAIATMGRLGSSARPAWMQMAS
ncbi:MAG: hypothetical protein SGPRY_005390, partial [Prymnesium sp.]